MRVLAVTVALAGCGYQSGSFDSLEHPFVGNHVTVECLDLAIARRADLPDGHAVVSYTFGNRCDHPVTIDLERVAVVARTSDGESKALAAYDPHHELAALKIDGRTVGSEAIAYESGEGATRICVDAASIAHAPTAAWLCFANHLQVTEAR